MGFQQLGWLPTSKGISHPGQVTYWFAFLDSTQLVPSGATAACTIVRILHDYEWGCNIRGACEYHWIYIAILLYIGGCIDYSICCKLFNDGRWLLQSRWLVLMKGRWQHCCPGDWSFYPHHQHQYCWCLCLRPPFPLPFLLLNAEHSQKTCQSQSPRQTRLLFSIFHNRLVLLEVFYSAQSHQHQSQQGPPLPNLHDDSQTSCINTQPRHHGLLTKHLHLLQRTHQRCLVRNSNDHPLQYYSYLHRVHLSLQLPPHRHLQCWQCPSCHLPPPHHEQSGLISRRWNLQNRANCLSWSKRNVLYQGTCQ